MESDSTSKQFTLLLASDNPPAWLMEKLQDNNETLMLAATAQNALTAINNRQFNLIIIDDALNGIDMISSAKATNNVNADTPFLALIGSHEYGQRKSLVAAGFDDCIKKPLSINSLVEMIALWRSYQPSYSYHDSIQKLLKNCRDNRKLATTLYKKLFTTLPEHLDLIETAIRHGNYQLALDTAHSLNGCVKTCFLQPIEPMANTLESTLVANKHELVEDCFFKLKQRVTAFIEQREAILNYLENPSAGQ